MLARASRYFLRRLDSFIFLLRSPVSLKVDVKNQSAIHLGKAVKIGFFGRLYANDPQMGSRIEFQDCCWLGRNIEIQVSGSQVVKVGRKATIQDQTKLIGDVTIGAYCTLASNVFLSSGSHTYEAKPELLVKQQDERYPIASSPIVIGEDTWIGNNVFIKAGVSVGRGCVIGANSVVLKDLEPYGVYGGIPAKKLKSRLEFSPPEKISPSVESNLPYFYLGFDHENVTSKGIELVDSHGIFALQSGVAQIILFYEGNLNSHITVGLNEHSLKPGENTISIQVTETKSVSYRFVPIEKPKGFKGRVYVASAGS